MVEVLENVEGTFQTVAKAYQKGKVSLHLLDGFGVELERLFAL